MRITSRNFRRTPIFVSPSLCSFFFFWGGGTCPLNCVVYLIHLELLGSEFHMHIPLYVRQGQPYDVLITKFCVDIYCKLVLRHNWLSSTLQNAAPPVEALRKAVMAVVRVWTYDIVVNNNYTCLGVARGPRVSPQMRCVLFAYALDNDAM